MREIEVFADMGAMVRSEGGRRLTPAERERIWDCPHCLQSFIDRRGTEQHHCPDCEQRVCTSCGEDSECGEEW